MDHINAKIKAMRGKLLDADQYRILCQSQSAEHFRAQLRGYPAYVHGNISMEAELERMRLFLGGRWGWLLSLEREAQHDPMKVWGRIKHLPGGQNRQALTYIKGTEIDLYNILCIYRLKRYYPEVEVYSHMVPVCYRLSREAIKQMAESPGVAEFIVAVKHTCYGDVLGGFENPERAISQAMRQTFSKITKRYPRSVAGVMGYFYDKKIEIRNLTTVLEGVQYHLPPDEIYDALK